MITNKDNPLTVTDTTPGGSGGTATASFAALAQKPSGSFTPSSGTLTGSAEGVVVTDPNNPSLKTGVMSAQVQLGSSPTQTLAGPVTKDTTNGVLTATLQDTKASGLQISAALAQVPTGSALSTASFYQTTSGAFEKVATDFCGSTATISNPTGPPLSGTTTVINGTTSSRSVQADLSLNSAAWSGDAFPSTTTGTVKTIAVGAVVGPTGQSASKTGPALVQVQLTPTSSTTSPLPPAQNLNLTGTATMQNSANRKVDIGSLSGNNPAPLPPPAGTPAMQMGTLTQR